TIWSTVVLGLPHIRQNGSSCSTCARIRSQSPLYPSKPRRPTHGSGLCTSQYVSLVSVGQPRCAQGARDRRRDIHIIPPRRAKGGPVWDRPAGLLHLRPPGKIEPAAPSNSLAGAAGKVVNEAGEDLHLATVRGPVSPPKRLLFRHRLDVRDTPNPIPAAR